MANRYFIQARDGGSWSELPTRPLYSIAEAQRFATNLRNAPKGDWASKALRIVLNGSPVQPA